MLTVPPIAGLDLPVATPAATGGAPVNSGVPTVEGATPTTASPTASAVPVTFQSLLAGQSLGDSPVSEAASDTSLTVPSFLPLQPASPPPVVGVSVEGAAEPSAAVPAESDTPEGMGTLSVTTGGAASPAPVIVARGRVPTPLRAPVIRDAAPEPARDPAESSALLAGGLMPTPGAPPKPPAPTPALDAGAAPPQATDPTGPASIPAQLAARLGPSVQADPADAGADRDSEVASVLTPTGLAAGLTGQATVTGEPSCLPPADSDEEAEDSDAAAVGTTVLPSLVSAAIPADASRPTAGRTAGRDGGGRPGAKGEETGMASIAALFSATPAVAGLGMSQALSRREASPGPIALPDSLTTAADETFKGTLAGEAVARTGGIAETLTNLSAPESAPRDTVAAAGPAAAQPTVTTAERVASWQSVVDQASRGIAESHRLGQHLSVELNPPDLGPLRIELTTEAGRLRASLQTDSAAAQQLITDHLPQLHESLAPLGLVVDRIEVVRSEGASPSTGSDARPQAGFGQGDAGQSSGRQQPSPPEVLIDEFLEAADSSPTPAPARRSRLDRLNIRI